MQSIRFLEREFDMLKKSEAKMQPNKAPNPQSVSVSSPCPHSPMQNIQKFTLSLFGSGHAAYGPILPGPFNVLHNGHARSCRRDMQKPCHDSSLSITGNHGRTLYLLMGIVHPGRRGGAIGGIKCIGKVRCR